LPYRRYYSNRDYALEDQNKGKFENGASKIDILIDVNQNVGEVLFSLTK